MEATEYRCPDCGMMATNMLIRFNTGLYLTPEQDERIKKEPILSSGVMYEYTCPISGKKYNVFDLKKHTFSGTVTEYKARYEGIFPKG